MACLEYLLQNFGFNNHGEVEELELFEPRLNIDMTSEELAKKVGCRLCWHQVFYFILAMCVINGYIFIGMIKNSTNNSQSELDWYKENSIYVINIAPLLSRDCVNERIEYMQKLGVKNVILSSVNADNEVIDFININSSSGNINLMKDLINKLKKLDMKVILKFIPNHSLTTKLIFARSIFNKNAYKDYYIWNPGYMNGTHHIPINNWLNVSGQSAWKWNDIRKSFYLHQFSEEEPDFNFRNKDIVNYFEGVFKFWLKTGIDGIYLDKVQYLFEDINFTNNTFSLVESTMGDNYISDNKATSNLPETINLLSEWGMLINKHSRILIVSDLDKKNVTGINMIHSPVTLASNFTGQQLLNAVLTKTTAWSSWEWVCDEKPNCWRNEIMDAFRILSSLLPGIPFINTDTKLFEENTIPNITFIEDSLRQLRSMVETQFGFFHAKLLNNGTVFAFNRALSCSDNLIFAWNLSKNITVLNLSSFDRVPAEAHLTICTQSACSILPPIKSKVDVRKLSLVAESAVVLTY